MFETLSLPSRKSPMKRTALSFAIGLHAFALLLIFSSSLWALEPIHAPVPYVVYQAELIALPAPEGVPAPRAPAAQAPAPAPREARPEPVVAQPIAVADPIAASPSGDAVATSSHASTETAAIGVGSPVGVPGGIGTTAETDGAFTDRRPSSEAIHKPGGDVRAPRILAQVKPAYPSSAVAVGVAGIVIVQAVINESGRVEGATVLRGHALLDEAALAAVAQWRFEPGRLNGKPVKVYFTLTVNFQLKR